MKNGLARHLTIATVLTVLSTFGMYFVLKSLFALPVQATVEGAKIDRMFDGHWWVISALFSLIIVFMLYAIFAFSRKEGEEGEGMYMHGNMALEVTWTVAPLILVLAFGWWGSALLSELLDDSRDSEAITIQVDAYKWAWRFKYPQEMGGVETSTLYLPKDRLIVLEMESQDVIHSFWIPEFRVKQDILPGRKTYLRFTPSMTTQEIADAHGDSSYQPQVRCAEICGTSHAYMLAPVEVLTDQAAFDEALFNAGQLSADPVERGEKWYVDYGCNSCHSMDGSLDGKAGPTWLGIYGREEELVDGSVVIADDDYIRSSIYYPNEQIVAGYAPNIMPNNFEAQFLEQQQKIKNEINQDIDIVSDLIEFMKTLEE